MMDNLTTPLYPLGRNQFEQNRAFLKPLFDGVDGYGLKTKIGQGDLGYLRAELKTNSHSGNKYGATKAGYLAKESKRAICGRFNNVFNDLRTIYQANPWELSNSVFRGYNVLIAIENATARMLRDDKGRHCYEFVDADKNNVYKVLGKAMTKLNNRLNKQRGQVEKSVVGVPFDSYGMDGNIESTLTKDGNGTPRLNAHIHTTLVINAKVDLVTFKNKLSKLLTGLGNFYINIEPITTDYPKLEHPAMIDVSKSLTDQKRGLTAFYKVARYNRKQVGYPDSNRATKDSYGNITNLTQGMALADFDNFMMAVSSVAIVNTGYNVHLHESYGVLRGRTAKRLHNRAEMIRRRAKTKLIVNYGLPLDNSERFKLLKTHLANLVLLKPPP